MLVIVNYVKHKINVKYVMLVISRMIMFVKNVNHIVQAVINMKYVKSI